MKDHSTQKKGLFLRMQNDALASELHRILTGRHRGSVKKIADILGISESTTYDYLNTRIKISIPFLQAAVVATDGDPEIIAFLIPEGWKLTRCECEQPDTEDFQMEMSDIYRSASSLHHIIEDALKDGRITQQELIEIVKAVGDVQCEAEQISSLGKKLRKKHLNAVTS